MSHIVEATTSIQQPDLTLLRQAATLVAQQHTGGTIEAFYVDYYGKRHPVTSQLAIFTSELHRGIGIVVDEETGELKFVGDPWAVRSAFEQIQQEVVQTYVSLATMQALQQMGYTAQATEGEQVGQVVIQGVAYA